MVYLLLLVIVSAVIKHHLNNKRGAEDVELDGADVLAALVLSISFLRPFPFQLTVVALASALAVAGLIVMVQAVLLRSLTRSDLDDEFFTQNFRGPYRALYHLRTHWALLLGPLFVANSTLLEEMVFRGPLLWLESHSIEQYSAAFVLSLAFGLIHYMPITSRYKSLSYRMRWGSFWVPFSTSIAMSVLVIVYNSLTPAWIVHLVGNWLTHSVHVRTIYSLGPKGGEDSRA